MKQLVILGIGSRRMWDDNLVLRHGLGMYLLQHFAKVHKFPKWIRMQKFAHTFKVMGSVEVHLIVNCTDVNDAVQALYSFSASHFPVNEGSLVVCHDDMNLQSGRFKGVTTRSGSGGHKALKKILIEYGDSVVRVKLGVGEKTKPINITEFFMSTVDLGVYSGAIEHAQEFLKSRIKAISALAIENARIKVAYEALRDQIRKLTSAPDLLATLNPATRLRKTSLSPEFVVLTRAQYDLVVKAALKLTEVLKQGFHTFQELQKYGGKHEFVELLARYCPKQVIEMALKQGIDPLSHFNFDFHEGSLPGQLTLIETNITMGGIADATRIAHWLANEISLPEGVFLGGIASQSHPIEDQAIAISKKLISFSGNIKHIPIVVSSKGRSLPNYALSEAIAHYLRTKTSYIPHICTAEDIASGVGEGNLATVFDKRVKVAYLPVNIHHALNRRLIMNTSLHQSMVQGSIRIVSGFASYDGIAAICEYMITPLLQGRSLLDPNDNSWCESTVAVVNSLGGNPVGLDGHNDLIVEYLKEAGYKAELCSAEEIQLDETASKPHLTLQGSPVKVVWCRASFSKEDILHDLMQTSIPKAVLAGTVHLLPSPAMRLFSSKALLPILYDQSLLSMFGLSDADKDEVLRYLTYAQILIPELEHLIRYLLKGGSELILKPLMGGGGRDVQLLSGLKFQESIGYLLKAFNSAVPHIVQGVAPKWEILGVPYEYDIRTIVFTTPDGPEVQVFARVYKKGSNAVLGQIPVFVLEDAPAVSSHKEARPIKCPSCGQTYSNSYEGKNCPRCATQCATCGDRMKICACDDSSVPKEVLLVSNN